MNRYSYRSQILIVAVVALSPMAAYARGKTIPADGGAVNFGAQLLHSEDGCVSLDGTVASGDFFDNLKREDGGSQPEYTKQGKTVTEYPELLTASIRILGNQCAARDSGTRSSIFNEDSFSLTFGVEWKSGMRVRPAVLSSVSARCIGSSVLINPSGGISAVPSLTCQITVNAKGVPLADHLIVSVFSADGKRLTRLSAAP